MSDLDFIFFKKKEKILNKNNFYKNNNDSNGTGLTKKFLDNLKPN